MADWRLAVDIGGTFTDAVLLDGDSGRVVVDKTLSTPSRPLEGVKQGVRGVLANAGIAPSDIKAPIVHATTLVTNALIEGKTARAGLVTNAGFADTLLIRNEHRYDMYDLQIEFPSPPVPRDRVVEIVEQVDWAQVGEGEPAHVSDRYWWTRETAIEPSPTALATRLIERERTSPATKRPGTLVSSVNGSRFSGQPWCRTSSPARTKPRSSRATTPSSQSVRGAAPMNTKHASASTSSSLPSP